MAHLTSRQKANKELKSPPEEDPEFQIAPMIDILLVLMVFFMTISSTEVLQANRDIILPIAKDAKAKSKETQNSGQVIVNVLWMDISNLRAIEIDNVKYTQSDQIVPRLSQAVQANPMVRVLIRADRSVRYEYLKNVLRSVGQSGITNVTFSVVDKDKPQPQAGANK